MNQFSIVDEEEDGPTVYDKLSQLCTEIETQISKVSGRTPEIEKSLEWMRSESSRESSPEAEYALRLFMKYVDEANSAKLKAAASGIDERSDGGDSVNLIGDIPLYLYDGTGGQIVGYNALKKNVFWSRVATGLFAFLSFVVMSTVPFISHKEVSADKLFLNNCEYKANSNYKDGYFSFVSYQYVLGLMVVAFVYCILFAGYYLLPVDQNDRKYIPGVRVLFERCLNRDEVQRLYVRSSDAMRAYSKSVEPVVDGGMFLMCLMASVLAAAALEHPEAFGNGDAQITTYFSLVTFGATFTDTSPACVDSDVVAKIRAAIAMCFLASFCLGFTFQVSLRSFFMEKRAKDMKQGLRDEHGVPMPLAQHEDSVRV